MKKLTKNIYIYTLIYLTLILYTVCLAEAKQLNGSIVGIMPKSIYFETSETLKVGEEIKIVRDENVIAILKVIKITGKVILTEIIQQTDKAITDFNKGIELNPQFAEAYFGRGLAYTYNGKYDSAIADLTKAIELNPQLTAAYLYRGIIYAEKKLKDLAIKDLKKAADLGLDEARKALKEYFKIDY